ncbi:MAG: amidohydrolase family protein [Rikenellaceae bacterium]
MRKITADYMISGGDIISHPHIVVDDSGLIVSLGRDVDDDEAEHYSGLLIPGMVNAHAHLEYSFLKGAIAPGGGLPAFIRSIIECKRSESTTLEEKIATAKRVDEKMFYEGVVAVGDHNNNDYVDEIKRESEIYYHTFVELFNGSNSDSEAILKGGKERCLKLYNASITPHASYSMRDDLLSRCCAERGIFSIHYKESIEMGGDGESDRLFASLSAERPSSILVHAIYATREDIQRAQDILGDRLTVVICPLSNYYIASRMVELNMLRESGVAIAIGTDSLSSNWDISMVGEMLKIAEIYPEIPLQEIISWATIGGARALGIESWAGTIEVGKRPGIVNIPTFDGSHIFPGSISRRIV